jgi:hypothetical protein
MGFLTAEEIVEANDQQVHVMEVPEWGGQIGIRVMTAGERDAHELEWMNGKERGVTNFRSKFLAKIISDKDGNRIFSDAKIRALSEKSGAVCQRIFEEGLKYNAVTDQDVEDMAGN